MPFAPQLPSMGALKEVGQTTLVQIVTLVIFSFFAKRYFYPRLRNYFAYRAAVRNHGCRPATQYPHDEPFWTKKGTNLANQRARAHQDGTLWDLYRKHHAQLGKTFVVAEPTGILVINTCESANIKAVAAGNFEDWGMEGIRSSNSQTLNPSGILRHDGAEWKHSRGMIKPIFARTEISDIDAFGVHVDKMLALLPTDGTTVDLQPIFRRMMLDESTSFLFGHSFNSLGAGGGKEGKEFLQAFSDAMRDSRQERGSIWVQSRDLFDKSFTERHNANRQKVYAYVDRHVKRAMEEVRNSRAADQKADAAKDDVEKAVKETGRQKTLVLELAKQIDDPIELRWQVLAVFAAAQGVPGIVMSNALFMLARNPDIWASLHKTAVELGDQPMTYELLASLHSVRNILSETFRLVGPSGRTFRTALRDTILPLGGGPDGTHPLFVLKGTRVSVNKAVNDHLAETWGDDCLEFKPDRFSGRRPTYEFTPFWAGPRICPAQMHVMAQGTYLLLRMARMFPRLENRDPVLEFKVSNKPLFDSANGCKVALFRDAKEEK